MHCGILKQGKEERDDRLDAGDGAFFKKTDDQWLLLGMLDYFYEAPPEKVAEKIRRGLADMCTAMGLWEPFNAWEIRDLFLYALAVNDTESARFISTMPEDIWYRSDARTVHWLVQQDQAAFALHHREEKEAAALLRNVRAMTFDQDLPVELKPDLPHIRNLVELLEAVQAEDGKAFQDHLEKRMKLRTDLYANGGECVPIALIDLHALGVCRMANDRDMKWECDHVYLPLDLLEVPPEKNE